MLLALQSQLSAGVNSLRSTAITLNVLLVTASTFLVGQVIGRTEPEGLRARLAAAALPLLIAGTAVVITRVVKRHHTEAAAVIRRIDEAQGLFEHGAYLPDGPVYPARWRHFGTAKWHEAEIGFLAPLQAALGVALALLVLLR